MHVYAVAYRDGYYPDNVLAIFSTKADAAIARKRYMQAAANRFNSGVMVSVYNNQKHTPATYKDEYVVIPYAVDVYNPEHEDDNGSEGKRD